MGPFHFETAFSIVLNVHPMKEVLKTAWVLLILLAPFVLWLLPSDYFDDTGIITCPSVLFFDVECIGCGMTRGIMHFHHFEYTEAIYYNYGVVVMYPLLVFFWFYWLRIGLRYFKIYPKQKTA